MLRSWVQTRAGFLAFLWILSALSAFPGPAEAYNILSLNMGAYWNDPYDQYFGARSGYGTPGQAGERWYTQVDYSDLSSIDLMSYDVLLVQSGFSDDWVEQPATPALAALNAKGAEILHFVQAGRGLVSWAEPFPDGQSYSWDWAPVHLQSRGIFHENEVAVVNPSHPALRRSTSESLSDWQSSWHGYFESWDGSLAPISLTGDYGSGDPRSNRALTLAGAYNPGGCGRMVFSMQDPDYHAYQGFDGARDFIGDALDWAGTRCPSPVPEPSSLLLLATGMAAAGLLFRPRRR